MNSINLKKVSPEDEGMSSSRLEKAMQYARRVSQSLGGTGGAVMVLRHEKIVGEWYWGRRGLAQDSALFDANTLVPLYSVTKGATATALSLLIQDGLLWLDEPAHLHIPELDQGDKARITVRHLATHSSGFPAGDADFYQCWRDRLPDERPPDPFVRHALMRSLAYEPGTAHIYSDPGVCLLGEIIFRVAGKRVPDILGERLFEPMGLSHIGWDFDDELAKDIAECVADGPKRSRAGTKDARLEASVAGGMISTAHDLAYFGQLLLDEGRFEDRHLIAPLTVRMMTSTQIPLPARLKYPHRGLFWWIKTEPETPELGHIVPAGTYCHGGAGHSVLVIMPSLGIVAVMLRNREGNPPGFIYNRDYPVFMDLVAAAVEEI